MSQRFNPLQGPGAGPPGVSDPRTGQLVVPEMSIVRSAPSSNGKTVLLQGTTPQTVAELILDETKIYDGWPTMVCSLGANPFSGTTTSPTAGIILMWTFIYGFGGANFKKALSANSGRFSFSCTRLRVIAQLIGAASTDAFKVSAFIGLGSDSIDRRLAIFSGNDVDHNAPETGNVGNIATRPCTLHGIWGFNYGTITSYLMLFDLENSGLLNSGVTVPSYTLGKIAGESGGAPGDTFSLFDKDGIAFTAGCVWGTSSTPTVWTADASTFSVNFKKAPNTDL